MARANKESVQFVFDPQPDITAFELAKLMPLLIPDRFRNIPKFISGLPDQCKRHIRALTSDSEKVAEQLKGETNDK